MANDTKKKETAKKATPKKKAAPKKAAAPVKKAAPKKEAAPKKGAAPAKKAAPKKEVAPKKAAPKKEAAPKTAPAKKVAPKIAEVPVKKAVPKRVKPASGNAPLAHGVGRRKSAVARVWLRRGKGQMTINQHSYEHYFDTEIARQHARVPFIVYPNTSHYDISANVVGGGKKAQADAVKLGVARALLELNPEIRPLLRQHGLLTVDSRVKERKKYGQRGARRKFQFVKR